MKKNPQNGVNLESIPASSSEKLMPQLETLHELNEVVSRLATYLEHLEHCEPIDVADIDWASERLLNIAGALAAAHHINIASALNKRLGSIQSKRGIFTNHSEENASFSLVLKSAKTWRALQVGQLLHDQECHANVVNNIEYEQLRHCTLHLAKIPFHYSKALLENDMSYFVESGRFADLVAFGLKLANLRRHQLPETPF